MMRKIIKIDESLCNGCGLCAKACHEGAIEMIDGHARLVRDDYCDGLGNCLPVCPTGAITFEEREAADYDADAVRAKAAKKDAAHVHTQGCPGSASRAFARDGHPAHPAAEAGSASELRQWPVQIKLAPVNAPCFDGADLLVAADCAAYACGNFHGTFMRGKITLIGCPKLDSVDYSEKLAEIIARNDIKSVTVVRMEVPCCHGIEHAVSTAAVKSGRDVPVHAAVLKISGEIMEER
ncbi:MAG: 4Fe-4S binding protein [Synergistaceae bacterium]|nr:4Fe-4S binding protein [Synergistaceae bacterium]